MHEELKSIYVSQENKQVTKANLRAEDDWSDAGSFKSKSNQENQEFLFDPSLVRDIFGGVLQTEFHIEGTKIVNVQHEPFFVLNLEIPRNGDNTLSTCLESYFKEGRIHDYQHKGRVVGATHK